jgi:O-6-methylguanine DNA methyltransferase
MYSKYLSPIGMIYYKIENNRLVEMTISDLNLETSENELSKKINQQLKLYFLGELKSFDIPISFASGTTFQKLVWNELLKIPYGKNLSYSKLASNINRPKAYRAVGQACKKNPIGIIVPCHRVIGKDHSLVGYSGKDYIHLKKYLLDHENKDIGENENE